MKINVLFCTDAHFWRPMGVSIASLLFSNPNHFFRVILASAEPAPPAMLAQIECLAQQQGNATVEFVLCKTALQYQDLPTHSHLTLGMYLRLFMTEFLDPAIERILYLDGDVLVCADVGALWQMDLRGKYLGAAPEPYHRDHREPLGFGPHDLYINSGVMLVDVGKWRRDKVLPRLMDFAAQHADKLASPDQDILNSVFRGHILNIGYRWNWQALLPRFAPEQLGLSASEYIEAKRHPFIVHYTSANKPWLYRAAPHYEQLYRRVLARTPWAAQVPGDRSTRNVLHRLTRSAQRTLEWHLPSVAQRLIARRHAS